MEQIKEQHKYNATLTRIKLNSLITSRDLKIILEYQNRKTLQENNIKITQQGLHMLEIYCINNN